MENIWKKIKTMDVCVHNEWRNASIKLISHIHCSMSNDGILILILMY